MGVIKKLIFLFFLMWATACFAASETGTASNSAGGWNNEANAYADGGGYANCTTIFFNKKSQFWTFGHTIPAGSTITGVEVLVDAYRAPTCNSWGKIGIYLAANDKPLGKEQYAWSARKTTGEIGSSETTYTLGSSTDKWGLDEQLSQEIINSDSFVVQLEAVDCAVAGSTVETKDGVILVDELKEGDMVKTFEDDSFKWTKVLEVRKSTDPEYVVINDTISVTPTHELYVNGGKKYADMVEVGDEIICEGVPCKVESVRTVKEVVDTFAITTEQGMYFLDGVLSYNKGLASCAIGTWEWRVDYLRPIVYYETYPNLIQDATLQNVDIAN